MLASALALSGCAGIAPGPVAFQARAPISAIDTDQTAGLRCLGRLIEASSRGPVEVVIGDIRDRTVPREFRDRRLSKGGEWWVHTAISNLKTGKVRSVEQGRQESANGTRQILFEGAWTQDDRVGIEGDAEFSAVIGQVAFSVGGDLEYDLIVGDFTSVQKGRVVYASAVGVVIGAGSGDTEFFIRDGLDSFAFDIGGGVTEGAQMAQRQITEAAVAAHLANFYGVDLRACLTASEPERQAATTSRAVPTGSASNASSSGYYTQMTRAERHIAMQRALKSLGYYDGRIDGIWGPRSADALRRFARASGLPSSNRPTPGLYRAARDAAVVNLQRRVSAQQIHRQAGG